MRERHELMPAAAFQSTHAFALFQQEFLQRSEQERAQPALVLIGPAQRVVFEHVNEKPLYDILSISRRIATTANECVKRRPVRFAKSRERLPRRLIRLRVARLQNDRPMRRVERRPTFLQRSRNRFRRR